MARRPYPCECCVHCGGEQEPGTSSIIWLSDATVTLAKCKRCGERLDPFVELEFPLIALELMLHRVPAFRHVLRNRPIPSTLWLRYAAIMGFIEVLSHFWMQQIEPTPKVLLNQLILFTIFFLVTLMILVTSAKYILGLEFSTDNLVLVAKALALSRFPSIQLIIAMAWWFPGDFYLIIAVYTSTALLATVNALPKADRMITAFKVAMPVLVLNSFTFWYSTH